MLAVKDSLKSFKVKRKGVDIYVKSKVSKVCKKSREDMTEEKGQNKSAEILETMSLSETGQIKEPLTKQIPEHNSVQDDCVVPACETVLKEQVGDLAVDSQEITLPELESDPIVRVVACQINVRKNGRLDLVVPGDEDLSRKLETLIRIKFLSKSLIQVPTEDNVSNIKLFNLSTIDQLEVLDSQLDDPCVLGKLTEINKSQEGQSPEEFLQSNLGHLMTDELAMTCSWSQKSEKKCFKNFKNLTIFLIDSTLERFPDSTAYKLENVIKYWLEDASNRLNIKDLPYL